MEKKWNLSIENLISKELDLETKMPYFDNLNIDIIQGEIVTLFDKRDFESRNIISNILKNKSKNSTHSFYLNQTINDEIKDGNKEYFLSNFNIDTFEDDSLIGIHKIFENNNNFFFYDLFKKHLKENENIKNITDFFQDIYPIYYKESFLKLESFLLSEKLDLQETYFQNLENFVQKNKKLLNSFKEIDFENKNNRISFKNSYLNFLDDYLNLKISNLEKISLQKKNIFNYIFEKINEFKTKEFQLASKKIKKDELQKQIESLKESKRVLESKEKISELLESLNKKKSNSILNRKKTSKIIWNFIKNFKNSYKIYKKVSFMQDNKEIKFHFYKLALLNKKTFQKFKKMGSRSDLSWLSQKDIVALSRDIREYNKTLWDQLINSTNSNMSNKNVKKHIDYEYLFLFKPYEAIYSLNKKNFKIEVESINKQINEYKLILKSKKNIQPEINEKKLYDATQTLETFVVNEKWEQEIEFKKLADKNEILNKEISFVFNNINVLSFQEKDLLKSFNELYNEIFEVNFKNNDEKTLMQIIKIHEQFEDADNAYKMMQLDFEEIINLSFSRDFNFKGNALEEVVKKDFIYQALLKLEIPYYFSYFKKLNLWKSEKLNIINLIISLLISKKSKFIFVQDRFFSETLMKDKTFILNLRKFVKKENIGFFFRTYSTQNLDLIADKIFVSYYGKIIEKGKTLEVIKTPIHPQTKLLLENGNLKINDESINYLIDLVPGDILKMYNVESTNHSILANVHYFTKWTNKFPDSKTKTFSFVNSPILSEREIEKINTKFELEETKIIDISYLTKLNSLKKSNKNLFLTKTIDFQTNRNIDLLTKTFATKKEERV
ncbi:MAG1360 family OppF-related protein [[Mycoplasma] mobile]|nr:hypothetical protein [[Mycoplasma] mobile]